MHDDDLLARLMALRSGLPPEAPAVQRITRHFRRLAIKLRREVDRLPKSNRHQLRAVCGWLDTLVDEFDPAELSEQPARISMLTETPTEGAHDTDPGDRIHDALRTIWRDLSADSTARRYLRELGDPPDRADALWTELHLASWRLPQTENQAWLDRFRSALVDVLGADAVPAPTSELGTAVAPVVPAVDWQGVFARDMHSIVNADEWQWVRDKLGGTADSHFAELISAVANVLTLLSAGDDRRMIWRKEHMSDRKLEIPQNLTDYRNELAVQLESLGTQQPGSHEELRVLVKIDELVRSVTHDPLPAPDSGWVRNVEKLLEWLRSKAERSEAKIEELSGTYNGCRDRTNLKNNVKVSKQEGDPGQVLWTLRTWSSIAGEPSPGRVIYVPTS